MELFLLIVDKSVSLYRLTILNKCIGAVSTKKQAVSPIRYSETLETIQNSIQAKQRNNVYSCKFKLFIIIKKNDYYK